jgi:ParD-like antitoxin of type II bacterial toxin-antitoxin system
MRLQIKISKELADKAITQGINSGLDMSNQIEHWAKIGKVVEDNPDLPYSFIKEILLADQEDQLEI